MPEPDVTAIFELHGRVFEDVNPVCRTERTAGPTVQGVRPGNADRWTMHAEFGAMLQACDAGLRGGDGKLVVEGIKICPWCKGDIKTLARELRLQSLSVVDADGVRIEFLAPDDFRPIRQGGKAWS
jgi:hypothetical protein